MTISLETAFHADTWAALFPGRDPAEFEAFLAGNQTAASETFERDGHMVTVQRGPGGRFGRGSRLGDVMHAVAEVDDDDEADGVEFGGGDKVINWGTRLTDGAYQLDFEDNEERQRDPDDEDEDEEEEDDYRGFARLRMSPSDMKRFAAGLSAALLVHQMQSNPMGNDDPNRPLIAALVANTPMNLKFENEWAAQSIDWGMLNSNGSVRLLAIDDDGDEASIDLTLSELRRLHAQLVRQNMEEDDNPFLKRPQTAAVELIEREGHMIPVNRGAKGRFSKMSAVAEALQKSGNAADSLAAFDRPALMREAKRRNLDVPRGAQADAVRALILDSTRAPEAPAATSADVQRAALKKLNVPALKTRARGDGHSFGSKVRKDELVDLIMSGPRNPDAPAERVIADRGTGQKSRISAGELPAANAEIDAMVAAPQSGARERMNNILGRMTLAQLQDVAQRHNTRLDGTVSTKDRKVQRLTEHLVGHQLDAASIERAIMGGGDRDRALEAAARDRQAAIDAARPRAEFLADLEEALGNDTDIAALRRMTNQALRIRGVAGDPHAEGIAGVVATSIDTGEIRRALNASTSAQGLRRLDAGDGFDPAQHTPIGKLTPGEPVELVRPGYSTEINGEQVTLTRPAVAAAPGTPAPTPAGTPAERIADYDRRIRELHVKMRESFSESERARLGAKREQLAQERLELAGRAANGTEPTTSTRPGINSREARDARAAATIAEQPRDRSVRRRAAARQSAADSPMRALSGADLTAALENVDADDDAAVRGALEGRDLAELVQIARDVPTVQMPTRQNRTALVDAIVRGTAGFRANANAMGSPFQGGGSSGMSPAMQRAMHERAPNGLVEGSPQTLEALERLGMVQKSPSGFYRATPHGIKSAGTNPNPAPTADDMSRAVGQGLTGMVRQAAAQQDIEQALARYQAAGDVNAATRAERLLAQQKRGLFTPEDVEEHLADLEASRTSSLDPVPGNVTPRPVTSLLNAHSLKRGDQFIGGNGEVVEVVGHRQGKDADGTPVQFLDVRGRDGQITEIKLGLNQPVDRLVGVGGGGGGTFALMTEVHEEFCLTPVVHPGPCVGWKDALPDDDPRKTRKAKTPAAPKPRRRRAAGTPSAAGPRLGAAEIAALPDDDLFNLFSELSKQDQLDEPLMRRLIEDMDRRERQTPVAALEDADLTPEQRRVDELVAGGRDYLSAYAEVHGGAENESAGAAAVDRRPGERLDTAVRRSYDEFTHVNYLQAEKATRGHMLNRQGQAAGIDPLTLFTGPVSRARRYASEDLTRWWARNGRMNLTQFRAQVLGGQRDKAAAAKTRQQSNARDFV